MAGIDDTVLDIIARETRVPRERITLDSTLKDLDVQSLDAIQVIFEIEDHFHIELPDRDPNFDTGSVRGLVEAVEKLVAAKNESTTGS